MTSLRLTGKTYSKVWSIICLNSKIRLKLRRSRTFLINCLAIRKSNTTHMKISTKNSMERNTRWDYSSTTSAIMRIWPTKSTATSRQTRIMMRMVKTKRSSTWHKLHTAIDLSVKTIWQKEGCMKIWRAEIISYKEVTIMEVLGMEAILKIERDCKIKIKIKIK